MWGLESKRGRRSRRGPAARPRARRPHFLPQLVVERDTNDQAKRERKKRAERHLGPRPISTAPWVSSSVASESAISTGSSATAVAAAIVQRTRSTGSRKRFGGRLEVRSGCRKGGGAALAPLEA